MGANIRCVCEDFDTLSCQWIDFLQHLEAWLFDQWTNTKHRQTHQRETKKLQLQENAGWKRRRWIEDDCIFSFFLTRLHLLEVLEHCKNDNFSSLSLFSKKNCLFFKKSHLSSFFHSFTFFLSAIFESRFILHSIHLETTSFLPLKFPFTISKDVWIRSMRWRTNNKKEIAILQYEGRISRDITIHRECESNRDKVERKWGRQNWIKTQKTRTRT